MEDMTYFLFLRTLNNYYLEGEGEGFTSTTCPGTMYGSTCIFAHKL